MSRALLMVLAATSAVAGELEDLVSSGAVVSNGNETTFTSDRVVSPVASLARRADGSWGGTLLGRPVDVLVTPTGMRGANMNLVFSATKGRTRVEGLVFSQPFRLDIDDDRFDVRLGKVVYQYTRERSSRWRPLSALTPYPLELKGRAATDPLPLPQLVFALIANGWRGR